MPTRKEWFRFILYCMIGVLMVHENVHPVSFWMITILIMTIDVLETVSDSGPVETYSENPSC